ncbi:MAG: sulfotransferase family 2 domain-containing protein [Pseudomonadota bacterium]
MWDWVRKTAGRGRKPASRSSAPTPLADAEERREFFYTTRRYPIFYIGTTKCGSTFLKNLFYALDFGVDHPDGNEVHGSERGLLRASEVPAEDIRKSPYAFAVVRDPTARFLSVYFDKIYGTGERNFPQIRQKLAEQIALDLTPGLSLKAHQTNCEKFADWVAKNLAKETPEPINYHWRQQVNRLRRAKGFPINELTLEGLNWQLPELVRPVIPDMAEVMKSVQARNVSEKPNPFDDVTTPALLEKLKAIYAHDYELHAKTNERWATWSDGRGWGPLPKQPHRAPILRGYEIGERFYITGSARPAEVLGAFTAPVDRHLGDCSAPTLVLENPQERVLSGFATFGLDPASQFATRYRRAGNDLPSTNPQVEELRAVFRAYLAYVARQLRISGSRAQLWMTPQTSVIEPALAHQLSAATLEELPTLLEQPIQIPPTEQTLPDFLDARLEEQIAGIYRADLDLYHAAKAE